MEVPKVEENKVTVRMPEELHQRLKVVGVRKRKSVQEIINGLVQAYVEREEATADG